MKKITINSIFIGFILLFSVIAIFLFITETRNPPGNLPPIDPNNRNITAEIVDTVDIVNCDYSAFKDLINNTNKLTDKNIELLDKNTKCQEELQQIKDTNNNLKIESINKTTTVSGCTTVVRRLEQKERELEECWFNSNATTINETVNYVNQTMIDELEICKAKLQNISEVIG